MKGKKGKKVIIGNIWLARGRNWEKKFAWTKPYTYSTPFVKIPHIMKEPAEKRLNWLRNIKVRITIEEV
jgi:hypothetical protein